MHTRSLTYTVELEGVQEHMQPEHVQAQMNAIASNANDIAKATRRLHLSHERRNSTLVIKMWRCISYFLPHMCRWTNRISKLRLFQTLLKSVEIYFALSPPPLSCFLSYSLCIMSILYMNFIVSIYKYIHMYMYMYVYIYITYIYIYIHIYIYMLYIYICIHIYSYSHICIHK